MARKKFYRNRLEIAGIDPQALWYLNGNKLILVDQDQFIDTEFDGSNFYPVDLSEEERNLLADTR